MWLSTLNQWLVHQIVWIELTSVFVTLLLVFMFWRIQKRLRKYQYLLKGEKAKEFEELLLNLSEKSHITYSKVAKLEEKFVENEAMQVKHFQNWALIRFKAFQNTGSDQSFAVALLDGAGDGVVITSIFGREESRVYCKLVENGSSTYPLSEEEKEAIAKAVGQTRHK